ncbi:MAG: TM2 domain-containing protein [Candidatus Lokiarchaeota archaeon]|nr:TM2 domain-containing protein [Candidatus Lokiarchaeota archaeon]
MTKYCQKCGTALDDDAEFCENCGSQQIRSSKPEPQNITVNVNNVAQVNAGIAGFQPSPKSKIVALILWIFLGYIGGHYFYAGRIGMGILYFFTVGFFGIGWCIDLFVILSGNFKDSFGRPMK